jgi:hypothetical protein
MTERTKTIKGLISGQVDMGTFGLVELELLAIEKENEALRKHAVSGSFLSDLNFIINNMGYDLVKDKVSKEAQKEYLKRLKMMRDELLQNCR